MELNDARYYFWGFAMNYTEVWSHFSKPELIHWKTNFVITRPPVTTNFLKDKKRCAQVVFDGRSLLNDNSKTYAQRKSRKGSWKCRWRCPAPAPALPSDTTSTFELLHTTN